MGIPMDSLVARNVVIYVGDGVLSAQIYENETGDAILGILPIAGRANRWGDEIYFSVPLALARAADAREVVEKGELGYWPDGSSFCIFFGKTPVSRGDEIRAASPVNIFGIVEGDLAVLSTVVDGARITVDRP